MKMKLGFSVVMAITSVSFAGGASFVAAALKQGKTLETAFQDYSQYLKNTYEYKPSQMKYTVKTSTRFGQDIMAAMESVGRGLSTELNIVTNKNLYSMEIKANSGFKVVNVKTMEDIKKADATMMDGRTISYDEVLESAKPGEFASRQTVSKEVQLRKSSTAESGAEAYIPFAKLEKEHLKKTIQERKVLDKDGIESDGVDLIKMDRDRQTARHLVAYTDLFPKAKVPNVQEVGMTTMDPNEFYLVTKDPNGNFSKYNFKLAPDNKSWMQMSKDVLGKDYQVVRSPSIPKVIPAGGSVFKTQPAAGSQGVTH